MNSVNDTTKPKGALILNPAVEVKKVWQASTNLCDFLRCALAVAGIVILQIAQLNVGFTKLPAAAFLLWTALISSWFGRIPGLCAALSGMVACNYLIEPLGEFTWNAETITAMLLFICVAVILVQCVSALRVLVSRERAVAVEKRQLADSLHEALNVRDTFLSIAGHELKTPLTGLFLRVQLWRRRLGDGACLNLSAKQVDDVIVGLNRLRGLVDSLLDVSRSTSGKTDLQLESIDADALVRSVESYMSDAAEAAGCEFVVQAESGRQGFWDRQRLEQILSNVIGNAFKYGHGRPVGVRAYTASHKLLIEVSDQGPGVALENQEKIFERFARLRNDGTIGGLGLGLWIVRELLQMMDGRIWVVSTPGEGCMFTIELPLENPDQNANGVTG